MEKMPFQDSDATTINRPTAPTTSTAAPPSWRDRLPILTGQTVTLRELEIADAASLMSMLTADEVARFMSPPPTTLESYERFILSAQQERQRGEFVCYGVVPQGLELAIGVIHVRRLEAGFATAEWGFAIGSAYWGTGIFMEAGKMAVDFAIDTLGVHRLEARAAVTNGRGNGVLRKIGAVQEGLLRRSFRRNGECHDQLLWTILDSDWRQAKAVWGPRVQVH